MFLAPDLTFDSKVEKDLESIREKLTTLKQKPLITSIIVPILAKQDEKKQDEKKQDEKKQEEKKQEEKKQEEKKQDEKKQDEKKQDEKKQKSFKEIEILDLGEDEPKKKTKFCEHFLQGK
jgi:hypothetical protein